MAAQESTEERWDREAHEFNPEAEDIWATFSPARKPRFKIHTARAAALGSMHGCPSYVLFRMGSDGLKHMVTKSRADQHQTCTSCGRSTIGNPNNTFSAHKEPDGTYDCGTFGWRREHGVVTDPPELEFLCEHCR